jgi:hypothetical protein
MQPDFGGPPPIRHITGVLQSPAMKMPVDNLA